MLRGRADAVWGGSAENQQPRTGNRVLRTGKRSCYTRPSLMSLNNIHGTDGRTMTSCRSFCAVLAVLTLACAVELRAADCVDLNAIVAQPVVFPNHAAGAVATNGTVIGVAKGATDGTQAVYFSAYDQSLGQIAPDVLVASQSNERAMALFWNGSDFGLFYRT